MSVTGIHGAINDPARAAVRLLVGIRGSAVISRERGEGTDVRCAIRHTINYTRNVIAASFPRRCAGNPRWVKFRVVAQRMAEPGVYSDDGLRDEPNLGTKPAQSRRVYRASIGS
jgi:hypothetical protein